MSRAENLICLVCDDELEPDANDVVAIDGLNWHRDCLGFIPSSRHYDYISHDDGHAIQRRFTGEVDMSVLLGVNPDQFFHREEG